MLPHIHHVHKEGGGGEATFGQCPKDRRFFSDVFPKRRSRRRKRRRKRKKSRKKEKKGEGKEGEYEVEKGKEGGEKG